MTQAFELRAISLPVKVNRFTKVADVAGTDDAAMLSNRQRDVGLESRDQALDLFHGWFLPYSDARIISATRSGSFRRHARRGNDGLVLLANLPGEFVDLFTLGRQHGISPCLKIHVCVSSVRRRDVRH